MLNYSIYAQIPKLQHFLNPPPNSLYSNLVKLPLVVRTRICQQALYHKLSTMSPTSIAILHGFGALPRIPNFPGRLLDWFRRHWLQSGQKGFQSKVVHFFFAGVAGEHFEEQVHVAIRWEVGIILFIALIILIALIIVLTILFRLALDVMSKN